MRIYVLFSIIALLLSSIDAISQPIARCKPALISLERISASEFEKIVNPSLIDDSSYSNVGLATLTLSKSRFVYQPFTFLSDIGVNPVSLTATDINGDTAVCNTFITVLFPILPLPEAKGKNDTVYLNKDGIGYLVPEQVNDSSISYVGQLEYEVTKKDFNCEDVGIVIDTLIVTDPIGSDSATVEVTVLDTIPPTVKCKDAVIELDKNGLFFLTPSMFDDGTTDACGIESLELSRQLVNCADIGVKEIWLIAKDINGNKDSCKANMLVVDFEEPEAICMNITVGLNSSGTVSITPQQISASVDNCGIELLSISASEFHCGHLGLNKVVLTVIDNSGNMNSCVADVKIENFIPPVAKCQDISIVYEGGTVKIGPDDINEGSVAFCGGIKSYEIDKNEFSCPNIGNNQVVLTVTDFSGLSNTCTSNVTINKPSVIKGRLFNTTNSLGPQSTPVFTTNNFPLLEIDEQSNIWAGSTGGGLYVYEQGLWYLANNPSPSGNSGFTVRALRREANGNIWAGMSKTQPCLGYLGKIYVYSDKNTLIKTFDSSQDPSQFTDLPSDVVRALDVNKSTNEIWAGCTPMICSPGNIGGLAYLPAGQNMFLQLNQGMPPASNLDRSVYAITSGQDSMVYIAVGKSCDATCTSPYIITRNASGTGGFLGTYTGANTPQLPLNSTSSNLALRALFVDSKNRLWVGGELNGIAVKDGSTWTFLPPGSIPYPNGAIINFDAIYEDKSGYIYFGTSNGFLRFNGENVTDSCNWNHFTLTAADVPNAGSGLQNIGSIRKDEKGYFWIATRAGIFYQREAAVVDVRASLFNKSLMKKPLQGVLVQAYNGNTPVGSLVTTNPSGDFVPALESDPQLEQGETYTLRFFYSKNPQDRFDEDLEFFVEDYELGMPLKDIQMPVSLLKQIRVQMDKMSPVPPSEPLKYDFKVLDYAITDLLFGDEFLDKDVFSMTEIKNVINPLDSIEYNEAVTTTENLGRVWLSLKLHESILDNKYEIIKLTPQLITIITDLFVQAKDLKETFEEKKPEKKKEKTPEEKEQEEFEKRLKKIEKIAQYWLDKKIAEAKDPETKKDFENYKKQISKLSSAFKLAGTDFNLIRNDKKKQKEIKEMYFKEIKTIALKALIIARYKLYCFILQDKIDALADLISSGTATGDFSAAVDTYTNQKAELDEYVDNIKNRLNLSGEVIESTDKLFNISEKFKKSKINEGIQNAGLEKAAQQNPSSTFTKARLGLKKSVKKLLLAIDVAENIWKGGWLAFGIEEIIRGELTIQYRQRIANDLMFNPATTTPAIIPAQQLAGNNFLSVTTTASADVTDFIEKLAKNDSLAGEIIQDVNAGADSLASLKITLWNTKGNELEEIFFKINQRFIAESSVADSVVSNYDSLRAQLEIAYMDHLIKGLRFDLGLTKWLSDTSQTGLADSLSFVLDTMEMANDYLEMAIHQMDNAVSGLSIGAKVLIDGISSPDIIQNNTSSPIIVTLSNYGSLSADSVVISASTDSLFSCTPDSIFISSINAGDSISIGFTVTAATPDTSVAFIVKVNIKNQPADLETVTLRSDQICTTRYFEDGDLDGYGSVDFISLLCEPTPGFVLDSTDCNDNDNKIFPGANELCNLIDDNCNSQVDENALITFYKDEDGDGFGNNLDTIKACQPMEGYVPSGNDCADTNALVFPTANERCNLLDDNCNSLVDENVLSRFYLDNDGDGFGNKNQFITACFTIEGYVEDSLDCNDVRADIFPGGIEKCNTLDDDCDGSIDEGCPGNMFFTDQDNDTFGNRFRTITISSNVPPTGYVTDSTDCSDSNASINPLATETCNGKDDDCDGQTDESLLISFYRDIDQDGFGDSSLVVQACIAPAGFVPTPGDCNNTVPTINPGASEVPCNFIDDNCNGVIDEGAQLTFYRDLDGDGFGNLSDPIAACSPPSGYVVPGTDCNDAASSVFPGALESCNLIDDNCDNSIDEGVQTTFHHDVDGDGFGNPLDSLLACSPPPGYVINKNDCNDNNPSISPLAGEICNTVDDDCDGQTDEGVQTVFFRDLDGDGFGNPANTSSACTIPAGFVSNSTDCNDNAVTVFPGGSETCNLIDDDCDTQVDEGVQTTFFRDQDGDGFGNPSSTTLACSVPAGFVSNNNDCNDNNNSIRPTAAETCNLIDDDCNAQIDEGVQTPFYRDADGDGFGNPNVIQPACSVPAGFVANDDDCNDARPNSFPGAQEQCNGIDDDCDGSIDEGVKIRFYRDLDQDGFGNQGAFLLSCSSSSGYVADSSDCNDNDLNIHPGADEICNGIDEDCDGVLDESCSGCAYVFNSTVNPAGCFGLSNGSAAISPSVPGLNYSWSNGLSGASVSGLPAGTYKVTISNNSGCIDSIFISIQQPSPINTALSVINVSCYGGFNGSIQSTVTGGAPPYNYLWSTNAIAPALSNLIAGSYTVTVTDLKGCTASATTNISEPAPILVNITGNPVSCFGGSNGSLTSSVSGGTEPYTWLWSNGSTSSSLTGLTSGTYSLTVKDASQCQTTSTLAVTQPTLLIATLTRTNVTCFGGSNGAITTSVSGGFAPYTYIWSTGASTSSITGLNPGSYTVTITDKNGCSIMRSTTINQPQAVSVTLTPAAVSCAGGSNGSVTSQVVGGTSPYSYSWSNGATTAHISNVTAGTYTLTVITGGGCTGSATATIVQPSPLSVTTTVTNVSCQGGNNGAITANVTGGTSPYSYAWSNGSTAASISGLQAGTYTVTVTSSGGCTATSSNTVIQPAHVPVSISASGPTTICSGSSVVLTASAGSAYLWSTGSTNTSITVNIAGTYSVMVTNASGCTGSSSIAVTVTTGVVPAISITANPVGPVTASTQVLFNATVSNGGSAPAYQWKKNGVNTGSNSPIYTNNTWTNGDTVQCFLTSNALCATPNTVESNKIVVAVNASGLPKFIVVDVTANRACYYDSLFNFLSSSVLSTNVLNGNTNATDVVATSTEVFVLDGVSRCIYRSTSAGTPSTRSRTLLTNTGATLTSPTGLTVSGDTLWVLDKGRRSIYRYSILSAFTGNGNLNAVGRTTLVNANSAGESVWNDDGFLYVLNNGNTKNIFRYLKSSGASTRSRNLLTNTGTVLNTVTGLTFFNSLMWVADRGLDRVYSYPTGVLFSGTTALNASSNTPLNPINVNATGIATIGTTGLLRISENALMDQVNVSTENVLRLVPNPSDNMVTLFYHINEAGTVLININDMAGKTVYSKQEIHTMPGLQSADLFLRDHGLSPGAYIISCTGKTDIKSARFMLVW